jgi:hypothetical protein
MYKVAKGGAITFNSFLNENDRNIARDYIIKTASSNMREAAKIGLQSLYADPKEVLEKYKDFDIVKEMQARKGAKLLWVRARAIDADVVNANGDLFSKEELLKEAEIKGQKIPAYKTFEGVPIYTNHKNDDIEQAKGMVVYAEWDEKENCVYCTFFVDEEAYPDIARNIRTGVIHDVSMGASVEWGVCSICSNKAYTEKDYCEHLKKYKGKTHPESGKKAYEKNYGVKFIELSCVGDGAFESCEIQEIYDVDDVLDAAMNLEKKANELSANIVLALQVSPQESEARSEYENCLRVANSTAKTAVRLAQQAGTLVGGPLLAGAGANQNSTVQAVLTALGIDPASGLNILDLINLSLNFLEVAVMNMFARKDNVDLGHVGKITKSMAELQSTMQDMIDDGVDVGSGQRPQQINQPQNMQQGQAPQASPMNANVGLANYAPTESVGKVMDLTYSGDQGSQVGGGVALASSNHNLVWASRDGKREVFASIQKSSSSNRILNLSQSILNLKENLNNDAQIQKSIDNVIRVANERSKNIKTNTPFVAGSRNQMDHFAKIASEQRKKLAAAVTIDFKVEDNAGNRVVLSTDGSITGYTNGKRTTWEPILNENQLGLMENGQGTRVAAELLKDYSQFVKTALLDVKERLDGRETQLNEVRSGESYDNLYEGVKSKNTGAVNEVREKQLEPKQTGASQDCVREILLGDAGLYGRRVKDEEVRKSLFQLVDEVTHGVPTEVLEKQLSNPRAEGSASAHEIMTATITALGKAVISSLETPKTILRVAQTLAEEPMLPEMIGTAAAGTEMEADKAEKVDFFGGDATPENSVSAVIKQLGAAVTSEITAKDLSDALSVAVEEGEMTKEGVSRIAELLMGQASVPGEGLDVETAPSKTEELKSALMSAVDADVDLISKDDLKSAISAMAMSSKETGTTPDEVVDSVEAMPEKQLMAAIDRAKTATATDGRLRARARREFWGVKTASTKNISDNVVGWLADYSTNFGISTRRIAKAAKRLCEEFEVAEKLVAKAVVASERTAGMTVTQSKSDCIRFMCRAEDLNGTQPSDSNFDESFKQKAIEVLQGHGFQVDPGTFSFTDLIVSENGDVTATVSTSSSKTFKTDEESTDMNAGMNAEDSSEMPVIMTESARLARKSRRDGILAKYAQAMPGMGAPAPQGPAAGPVEPGLGSGAPAGGDLGISSLTGGADMNESADMDAVTEPGEKKPWGSVCPVCGADDVNISESNADCQSCGTTYKILQQIELISMGDKGKSSPDTDPMGLGPDTGLGAATAPAELPAPSPAAPGMGPVASDIRTMIRLSATVDSDVYLKTALPSFDRTAESMLPVGMVCPSCGDREAHKVKSNTFCYKCGNYSRTTVQASKKDPSKLDVSITWID